MQELSYVTRVFIMHLETTTMYVDTVIQPSLRKNYLSHPDFGISVFSEDA